MVVAKSGVERSKEVMHRKTGEHVEEKLGRD